MTRTRDTPRTTAVVDAAAFTSALHLKRWTQRLNSVVCSSQLGHSTRTAACVCAVPVLRATLLDRFPRSPLTWLTVTLPFRRAACGRCGLPAHYLCQVALLQTFTPTGGPHLLPTCTSPLLPRL